MKILNPPPPRRGPDKAGKSQILNSNRGSVLLLTLLLLSLFLFIGLVWSTLVLRGLKIVEKTDEAVVAFAAAESGVEDGLFRLQKNKELPKDITGQSGTLANGSSWQRNVYSAVTVKTVDTLNPGAPLIIDLYNPDVDPLTATLKQLAFGAASLTLAWDSGTIATVTAEITEWNGALIPFLAPVLGGTGGTIDGLDKAKSYRLTLTTTQPIKNIRVSATDKSGGTGNVQSIPEALSIESNGLYQSATQAIRMRFPRVSPFP